MEGFGLRGIPRMVEGIMVDNYLVYAWGVYGLLVVLSFTVFLLGNATQSTRAARVFVPLLIAAVVLAFATPTGTHM